MTVLFNKFSEDDHARAIEYYGNISERLADRFDSELALILSKISENPNRFHLTCCKRYRRANFNKFPYHLLYRVSPSEDLVRILVIRHDQQHPDFGLDRPQ